MEKSRFSKAVFTPPPGSGQHRVSKDFVRSLIVLRKLAYHQLQITLLSLAAMFAAYLEATGDPEVIKFGELPTPTPGPVEVRVRVLAVSVNPIDTYIRGGDGRDDVAESVRAGLRFRGNRGRGRLGRHEIQTRSAGVGIEPRITWPTGNFRGILLPARRLCLSLP